MKSSFKGNSVAKKMNVNFCAPLLDYGYPLPLLNTATIQFQAYLALPPGFDSTYICPFIQFPELGTEFEVCMMLR